MDHFENRLYKGLDVEQGKLLIFRGRDSEGLKRQDRTCYGIQTLRMIQFTNIVIFTK